MGVRPQTVRKLALALPEACEQDHFDRPSFRVRKRIFAVLRASEGLLVLKGDPDEEAVLVESEPETFVSMAWGTQCWTGVRLAKIKRAELNELLVDAWRRVAPKRVIAAYDARPTPRLPER